MIKSFVQYINFGTGFFENTCEIESRDVYLVAEKVVDINEKVKDANIIGYRIFDREDNTSECKRISGVYYVKGEVFTYPSLSNEMLQFVKSTGKTYKKGQKVIVIIGACPIVTEFFNEDKLLNITKIRERLHKKRKKEELEVIYKEIDSYKNRTCDELTEVINAIKQNNFKDIKYADIEEDICPLNINHDNGNFELHERNLKSLYKKARDIELELSSVDLLDEENETSLS